MAKIGFEIEEYDEAGNLVATYINSAVKNSAAEEDASRIDVILPKETKSMYQKTLDVFLPAGYPHSVTEDYLPYQIYDSLQAFSSAIAGLLSSRAVLEGVGVGDATASPTAALLLSIFQESAGRIATILFAHKLGTSLEPECKMYRLAADIFNDTAMILDCLSPAFPKPFRVVIFCFSSILRALCGVAAGSSKASLSAHFAKWGNLGELNAKDSSQETVISLVGMLVGSIVVSQVTTPILTWISMLLLLTIHLSMNHAAVRAVNMQSLNRQRANIAFSHLLAHDKVLTPQQVSKIERVFERDGVFRWVDDSIIGHGNIGVSLQTLVRSLGVRHETTGSVRTEQKRLANLLDIYKDESYVLSLDKTTLTVYIALKRGSTSQSQLKAWCNGLLLAHRASTKSEADVLPLIADTLTRTTTLFNEFAQRLKGEGWDLDIAALETHSGTRLMLRQQDDLDFHDQKNI